ncbi:polysaccharide pyruvyl transferase, partial [Streptomyces sp. 4F]
ACGWPALVAAERMTDRVLERWWDWCLTGGREEARRIGAGFRAADAAADSADGLVAALGTRQVG